MPTAVQSVLADLSRAFRVCELRWYVFGAQAVAAAGVPRATADVDVTVAATRVQVPMLVSTLHVRFDFRAIGNLETFIAQSRVLPLQHRHTATPVDVVLAGPGLEDEMLARSQHRRIGRLSIPFIEINDLLVVKVLAGRPKDLDDVRGLVRARPAGLDLQVTRDRIERLGRMLDDSALVHAWDGIVREQRSSRRPPKTRR